MPSDKDYELNSSGLKKVDYESYKRLFHFGLFFFFALYATKKHVELMSALKKNFNAVR